MKAVVLNIEIYEILPVKITKKHKYYLDYAVLVLPKNLLWK